MQTTEIYLLAPPLGSPMPRDLTKPDPEAWAVVVPLPFLEI